MRSKVHPKYKTKYRVGNWSAYEQALVQRGDVTLWLSADATDAWRPSPSGRPGAPKKFSDCAIETALTLRLVFRLPLRQAEGFLRSVLSLMGVDLEAPDHTTLSRRSQSLAVEFRRIPSRGPIHLIVDSTGLSIVGEGEWGSGRPGSLLTLAPHRSGRAGSAASGSSIDGFATRRRVPAGPGSQAMATAIPKACLASSAIRCRDVETGPNLGVLAVFPSTGATCRCPLPSTGSRGLNSPASAVL